MLKLVTSIYREIMSEPIYGKHGYRDHTFVEASYFTIRQLWAMGVCRMFGHNITDDDPGDPEVGPQPDIYCTRCGKHF